MNTEKTQETEINKETLFEDDLVYQTINLLNMQSVPILKMEDEEFYNTDQSIGLMMKNLEMAMIEEKQQEINSLTNQLRREREENLELENKLTELVNCFTCSQDEMSKFIKYLLLLMNRNQTMNPVLSFGPFLSELQTEEFLELMKILGDEMTNGIENSSKTNHIMKTVNDVLQAAVESQAGTEVLNNHFNYKEGHEQDEIEGILPSSSTAIKPSEKSTVIQTHNGEVLTSENILPGSQQVNQHNILEAKHGEDTSASVPQCICGKVYTWKGALTDHIRSKLCQRVFQCYICSKRFNEHRCLKGHVKNIHKQVYQGGKSGCIICGKTFDNQKECKLHMKTHQTQNGENH